MNKTRESHIEVKIEDSRTGSNISGKVACTEGVRDAAAMAAEKIRLSIYGEAGRGIVNLLESIHAAVSTSLKAAAEEAKADDIDNDKLREMKKDAEDNIAWIEQLLNDKDDSHTDRVKVADEIRANAEDMAEKADEVLTHLKTRNQ